MGWLSMPARENMNNKIKWGDLSSFSNPLEHSPGTIEP